MSSEALMEKPTSGKCRCRNQSWYLVLISFLLWFTLFYLYSSSITFGKKGDNFLGNNHTDFVESSESLHDVARQETGDSTDVTDVSGGDNMEEASNESEKEQKPMNFSVDGAENVDQVLVVDKDLEADNQTMAEENETESVEIFSGKENGDDQLSNEAVNTRDEDNKPFDPSSMEEVTKQKGTEGVSELPREENEDQPVDSFPIVKSRRERAKPSRGRNGNKPADSSPVTEKRIENVAVEIPRRQNVVRAKSDSSSCSGRYIYIHDLPRKFNEDLLDNCRSLSFWTDMCECASNLGLGATLPSNEKLYSRTGWFATNQFLLEVIFHNRMKQYKCLTKDPSVASAIYVPYYAGLDVGRYLWDPDGFMRDYDAVNLVKWLAARPEWKKMWGRDHFLVAGRINWDFRRDPKNESDWGNELLNFPESKNMTMLVIESSPWNNNDFAIPYPTYFHPSRDEDVFQWQNRMRRQKRRFLFSFAGARRPNLHESIRNEIIDQCLASRRKCRFLECDKSQKCHKPVYLMKLFQSSVFCLQPPGDSYTRRSIFDSILAGCIPVFFHPGSAYVQYIWHFPKDYTKYSVLIPANDVKSGNANIERILQRIPREKRVAMREEVIRLIPKVIYADPSSRLGTIEDAFDLTIKGVLDRVETVRNQMRDGQQVNSEFDEQESWKYFTFGKLGVHEWDPFFSSKLGKHGT
ncbi:PREDICTED: probable xyloglucan galactosyltransferase GT14 [Theobroma cacao]|uniref:Probable xyloglucan galactosyltransferase GT14 n=1 Tax=Theobroma cacao TaxID=3641 RepID=A0AB32UT15_THECC|nr:PREDICTED: probable xyloglucan galactosyltransferase GT14 [Theobroma cacao]